MASQNRGHRSLGNFNFLNITKAQAITNTTLVLEVGCRILA